MRYIIFLTWTEKRAWIHEFGKPVAALWIREGSKRDIQRASDYARTQGPDYTVFATDCYELFAVAKQAALANHAEYMEG
jgi:hypothetical protein